MLTELAGQNWAGLRMIPLPPLAVALFLALVLVFGRRPLSRRTVAAVCLMGLAASFLASVLSFADLVSNDESSALIDRVAIWVGAGVGDSALIGDLALRFDALSSVFSLVIAGVGLLLFFYLVRLPELVAAAEGDSQRFFCLASFQVGMSLLFVLADNLLLLLLAFVGVGVASSLLAGFRYADAAGSRLGSRVLMVGRIGDVALLIATLLIFRALSDAGAPGLVLHDIRAALLGLEGVSFPIPGGSGPGEISLLDAAGLCLLMAAASMLVQLSLFAGFSPGSPAPLPGSALMQTVTGLLVAGYLVVRFSFVFMAAPLAAATMTGLGAFSALGGAVFACRSREISRVLAWSSVSQLGLVLLVAGLGAQTAAVFHMISHAFFKGLLLMTAGVVILAVKGEHDMGKMGNLGSRLTLTRIGFFVGAFSLAGGLPLTAGFFSVQQIVVAARGADPGAGFPLLYPLVLLTVALTTFYIVRLILLSLYGETRLAPHVHWDDVEDPDPTILWTMGILASLSILGAVIGFPQFWADLLFGGDIARSNSLHYFLSGLVSQGAETSLDFGQTWAVTGWTLSMTLLGLAAAILVYGVEPAALRTLVALPQRLHSRWRARLPAFAAVGLGRWKLPARAEILAFLGLGADRPAASETAAHSVSASLLRLLADRLLKHVQSGLVQHSLALSVGGSFALLVYFLWAGGH